MTDSVQTYCYSAAVMHDHHHTDEHSDGHHHTPTDFGWRFMVSGRTGNLIFVVVEALFWPFAVYLAGFGSGRRA